MLWGLIEHMARIIGTGSLRRGLRAFAALQLGFGPLDYRVVVSACDQPREHHRTRQAQAAPYCANALGELLIDVMVVSSAAVTRCLTSSGDGTELGNSLSVIIVGFHSVRYW